MLFSHHRCQSRPAVDREEFPSLLHLDKKGDVRSRRPSHGWCRGLWQLTLSKASSLAQRREALAEERRCFGSWTSCHNVLIVNGDFFDHLLRKICCRLLPK